MPAVGSQYTGVKLPIKLNTQTHRQTDRHTHTLVRQYLVWLQSDANKRDKKNVDVYQLMMDLLRAEEQCANNVRQSEREVQDILEDRVREELTTDLTVSIYDTQRNDKAKKHREMLVSVVHLIRKLVKTFELKICSSDRITTARHRSVCVSQHMMIPTLIQTR